MPEIVLKTINLGKKFRSKWVVKDLNIEIFRGDVFGFLGPNGAGKSTSIRMIFSLIRPSSGRVEIFNESVEKNKKIALEKVSGIVEKPDFYLYLSAYNNMKIAGSLSLGRFPEKEKILQTLKIVGLEEVTFKKVKTFSHGMKQRLGIAQALLTDPELIVLDEPTNGLDPQGVKDIRELIKKLSKEKNITILLSSHILSEVEQVATRMAIINKGELIVQGKVKDLLKNDNPEMIIKGRPLNKIKTILKTKFKISDVKIKNGEIHFKSNKNLLSKINLTLVKQNCDIFEISKHNSLEEYFLTLTNK